MRWPMRRPVPLCRNTRTLQFDTHTQFDKKRQPNLMLRVDTILLYRWEVQFRSSAKRVVDGKQLRAQDGISLACHGIAQFPSRAPTPNPSLSRARRMHPQTIADLMGNITDMGGSPYTLVPKARVISPKFPREKR
eukprot:3785171-Amphidinium_carterae.1